MRFIVCLVLFNVFKQNKSFLRKERILSFHSSGKKNEKKILDNKDFLKLFE
jgi:hypothetical protein